MKKLVVLTALTSASIVLSGCNSAPKEEAPAATEAAATDGSDDTETGGGGIKPVDSGN